MSAFNPLAFLLAQERNFPKVKQTQWCERRSKITSLIRQNSLRNPWDLRKAKLGEVDLRKAYLVGVDLNEADLTEANLKEAIVTDEQLNKTVSFKGAIKPDGSIHPKYDAPPCQMPLKEARNMNE